MRSDEMLGNGLPTLVHSSSDMPSSEPLSVITDHVRLGRMKKQAHSANTMLFHMNNDVRALRRARTTQARAVTVLVFTCRSSASDKCGCAVRMGVVGSRACVRSWMTLSTIDRHSCGFGARCRECGLEYTCRPRLGQIFFCIERAVCVRASGTGVRGGTRSGGCVCWCVAVRVRWKLRRSAGRVGW